MKKIILLMLLVLCSVGYAIELNVNTFDGQTDPFNLTFLGRNAKQYYSITYPDDGYIKNITIGLTGVINNTSTLINKSTPDAFYCDANWLATAPCTNIWDLNISSYGTRDSADAVAFLNYTLPPNYTNASYYIAYDDPPEINYDTPTLTEGCHSQDPIQIKINSTHNVGGGVKFVLSCYTGSAWYNIITNSDANAWTVREGYIIYNVTQGFPYIMNVSLGDTVLISKENFNNQTNISISQTNGTVNLTFLSLNSGKLKIDLYNATYAYGIDNCSNSLDIPSNATALNVSIYNLDDTATPVNYSTYVEYGDSKEYNASFEMDSTSNVNYCIYPEWFNQSVDYNIQYQYGTNYFNSFGESVFFDNITNHLFLYVDTGEEVTATVYDNAINPLEDAYIRIQRYDWATGNYIEVGQVATNSLGQAKMYLTLNSVYYRFLIYYPQSTLRQTTSVNYVYSTTIEFIINVYDDTAEDYYTTMDVVSVLSFDNDTNRFEHEFADSNSIITAGCLRVWLTNLSGNNMIDDECVSSTSGIVRVSITPNNGSSFLAKSYIIYENKEWVLDSLSVTFWPEDKLGLMGVFICLALTIVFAFMFRFSIALGCIITPIPVLLCSFINIIQLEFQYAIGVQIVGFILAYFVNDRG